MALQIKSLKKKKKKKIAERTLLKAMQDCFFDAYPLARRGPGSRE